MALAEGSPEPVRAVAYVRVSQARDGMISPELQLRAIREFCDRRHFRVEETIQDLDLSGRFWKLRQVERAIRMVEQDQADVIVVWRWSRIARNRLDWAQAVDRVEAAGGRLESAVEGFDTSTSSGRLARGMLAELAAYESDRTGDIWREIWSRRARNGLPSHGHNIFGYRKKGGHYVPDRKTGPIVAELYQRYVDGTRHLPLVHWLNHAKVVTPRTGRAWTQPALVKAMDNGFAAGYVRYQGDLLPGAHKPLITKELWLAYQARRERLRQTKQSPGDDYLLTGIVWCGCGRQMQNVRKSSSHNIARYGCYRHPPKQAGTTIARKRCDAMVRRWVYLLATDPRAQERTGDELRRWVARCELEAYEQRRRLASCTQEENATLQAELTRIRSVMVVQPVLLARALVDDWDTVEAHELQGRLAALVQRVTVHNDRAEPLLEMHTTWGSVVPFVGLSAQHRYTAEQLSPVARDPRPAPGPEPEAHPDPLALLTPGEAARVAGVTVHTLWSWYVAGRLPNTAQSLGKRRLYSIQDIRAVRPSARHTGGWATRRSHAETHAPSREGDPS